MKNQHNYTGFTELNCKILLVVEYPSCEQTTVASVEVQPVSHTYPHVPLTHTWTLPS